MATRKALIGGILASAMLIVAFAGPAAAAGPAALTARLRGAAEVPGPGDEDGRGRALVVVSPRAERVCFVIQVSRIRLPAVAAHIHAGTTGVAGDIVVTLEPPDEDGLSAGCVDVADRSLLRAIKLDPEQYYVNVHNARFPDGAVRGQLRTV